MSAPALPRSIPVVVHAARTALRGDVLLPPGARGLIAFAHGSGSSRTSPRNQFVASALAEAGLATLLFDLLTVHEEATERYTRHLRFDIPLLAARMVGALRWLETQRDLAPLPVGLFGASTGAAAALLAATTEADRSICARSAARTQITACRGSAAERPTSPRVRAVVSRGGRPDLAGEALREVRCPTLLIVGGADRDVLELNRRAMQAMTCPTQLEVVAGATHLFEEPGALEQVAALAARWFRRHVAQVAPTAAPPSP